MGTYLFLWNPKKWAWASMSEDMEQIRRHGRCAQRWSCGTARTIKPGDRIFMLRVGRVPRGIFASGYVVSEPFPEKHWGTEGKLALYVGVELDALLDPDNEPILTTDLLRVGNLAAQNWQPLGSGCVVRPALVNELEAVWLDFLAARRP